MEAGKGTTGGDEDELLESALDDALGRLASGQDLDLEAHRETLGPSLWPRFAGMARAEEYRWRTQQGEDVALEPLLEGLEAGAREHFLRTLALARLARSVLPHRIEPGMEIRGRWLVLRPLGSGGQAKVYAAWDREFELEVALKVFDEPALGTRDAAAALGESRVLAHLRSRNIVRIFDVVREEGLVVVVMDLVRGIRLRDALDRLRAEEASGAPARARAARLRAAIGRDREGEHAEILDERDWYRTVARVALVMARTLEQAHERGIAHRDLNPKNAMLVGGGEPVLLDFGLAARRGTAGPLGWTFPYVAPERIGEEGSGTEAQGDVYQLGLVLYELLTLERAYALREGESTTAVLLRITRGEHRRPREICAEVPEGLEAICLHALATRPERRYAAASELARDLERWLRRLPPIVAPLRPAARLRMRARYALTSPITLGAAALAAVIAVTPVFAGEQWTPPRVQAITYRDASFSPVRGQSISPGTALGAEVDCPAAADLYAFTLSGEGPEVEGFTLGTAECMFAGPDRTEKGHALLERGKHLIFCTRASTAEREGLLLVFSPRENPVLSRLLAEVEARCERFEPVTYGDLPVLLANLTNPTKGDPVSSMTEEERRELNAAARALLRSGGTSLDDLWRLMDVRQHLFVYPVSGEGRMQR